MEEAHWFLLKGVQQIRSPVMNLDQLLSLLRGNGKRELEKKKN